MFHPLDKAQIREIARIQLRGLDKRLAERGIRIELTDEAYALLGNVGFDPVYGARPLKRAIQQQLENPLATQILSGEFGSGDTVHVDAEGGAAGVPQGLTVQRSSRANENSAASGCLRRSIKARSRPAPTML